MNVSTPSPTVTVELSADEAQAIATIMNYSQLIWDHLDTSEVPVDFIETVACSLLNGIQDCGVEPIEADEAREDGSW